MSFLVFKTKKGSKTTKAVAVAHDSSTQNISEVTSEITGEKVTGFNKNKTTETITAKTQNFIVDFVPGEIPL